MKIRQFTFSHFRKLSEVFSEASNRNVLRYNKTLHFLPDGSGQRIVTEGAKAGIETICLTILQHVTSPVQQHVGR
jgi:hypothetical protein